MLVVWPRMLGQIGLPGGGFGFGYGAEGGMGNPRRPVPIPVMQAGRNPTGLTSPWRGSPTCCWNPARRSISTASASPIPMSKLVYWAGGNPFHHHQDLNRLVEAWRRPDTVIVHEPWWTSTARHADIVLPATTTLERNDVTASSRDRFILAMHKAIEPVGEARNDFDIFSTWPAAGLPRGLHRRARARWNGCAISTMSAASRRPSSKPNCRISTNSGKQGHVEFPGPDKPYVMFEDFRTIPASYPLRTPSGRIEIFSEKIASFGYDDCPGHPVWLEPREWLGAEKPREYPLHLISNQPATRLHGQMDISGLSRATKLQGPRAGLDSSR